MDNIEVINELEEIKNRIDVIIQSLGSDVVDIPDDIPEPTPVVNETRSPTKKAFLVGINKYDPSLDCDLSGCVNDVNNMESLLSKVFDFKDIVRLTDYAATKTNIIKGIESLISGSVPGDQLVLFYSGHGSQVPDLNGDEPDNLDEILCPTDLDWDDPFTDDILASLFKKVPVGSQLTFICDSCHSGTVTRVSMPRVGTGNKRYLEPPFEVTKRAGGKSLQVRKFGQKAAVGVSTQRHILFAGCSENEYSYEGVFNGKPQGAFTWNFARLARTHYNDYTWKDIEGAVCNRLDRMNFFQEPQLVTMTTNFNLKMFGIE